ncbi:MAG: hypothetical protein HKM95_07105 [Inquilinus sp.]|nr:hypothetical protein [Inquilinus sp.]
MGSQVGLLQEGGRSLMRPWMRAASHNRSFIQRLKLGRPVNDIVPARRKLVCCMLTKHVTYSLVRPLNRRVTTGLVQLFPDFDCPWVIVKLSILILMFEP